MRALPVLLLAVLTAGGCELREITIALPQDIVVAEVILQAGERVQTAYLHRTLGPRGTARVLDATVIIQDEELDRAIRLFADADSLCLRPAPPGGLPSTGTCYIAHGGPEMVRPGALYTLRVELPDRPVLTGTTRVPAAFEFTVPAAPACRLPPHTTLELAWTVSESAWVYVAQARFEGLVAALRTGGTTLPADLEDGPIDLLGLAISSTDTTMSMPAGFGLFDRANVALHPVLTAIRNGLPPDVTATVAVAAADRNYVNWVRGGSFNPSGTVRIPSVSGGGTGVFGSLLTRRRVLRTDDPALPPCT
jgi:hypothetical protein